MNQVVRLLLKSNSIPNIEGGEIINGKIILEYGGEIEISQVGLIDLNYSDHLEIKSGGELNIISGEISTSSIIN